MRSDQTQPDQLARRWISVEEAGAILGVGRARAYQLVAEGTLPAFRVSERRLLVPLKALDELEDVLIERAREIATRRSASAHADEAIANGIADAAEQTPVPRLVARRSRRGRKR